MTHLRFPQKFFFLSASRKIPPVRTLGRDKEYGGGRQTYFVVRGGEQRESPEGTPSARKQRWQEPKVVHERLAIENLEFIQ